MQLPWSASDCYKLRSISNPGGTITFSRATESPLPTVRCRSTFLTGQRFQGPLPERLAADRDSAIRIHRADGIGRFGDRFLSQFSILSFETTVSLGSIDQFELKTCTPSPHSRPRFGPQRR